MMQSGKIISLSVWLMISFNLLLAAGAVWSFQRMGPEIRQIFERNVVSLDACENMFLALADDKPDLEGFRRALGMAERNITERGEEESLKKIRALLHDLENGDLKVKKAMGLAIRELSEYNKRAIIQSAEETQRMRQAGAWGIVFMTFFFFIAALFFEQRLRRALLRPLQEIASVLEAHHQGDKFRRCNTADASQDMKKLLKSIDALLDSSRENKRQ